MTSPYHPASNGLAERAVQTLKSGLKKMRDGNLETRLARFLFWYRTTPHATTGVSPAELMFGRRLRSPLDKLKPELSRNVRHRQESQKSNHDYHAKEREMSPGCTVYAKNFGRGKTWLSGVIIEKKSPVSFMVKLTDDRLVKRHIDHLRFRESTEPAPDNDNTFPVGLPLTDIDVLPDEQYRDRTPSPQPLRRSTRSQRPPQRYGQDSQDGQ